ncbi:MAG: hypothetical protein WCI64_11740 [Chlorobium sp.]
MSDEELRAYNRYQDSRRDEASYVETNYLCAKMEGKEETTRTIALRLIEQGVEIAIIKAVTGLRASCVG